MPSTPPEKRVCALRATLGLALAAGLGARCLAQQPTLAPARTGEEPSKLAAPSRDPSTHFRLYVADTGVGAEELTGRALTANDELAAARLEVERLRARIRQAGLRPNPTLEVEHAEGRVVGSPGECETTIGVELPLELGRRRARRVELARAELAVAEAELADRERKLALEINAAYADALAAARELEIVERLLEVERATARFVQVRVEEGESAPLDLNLVLADVDRLGARVILAEGKVQAALFELRALAGLAPDAPLVLAGSLTPRTASPPPDVATATAAALVARPDLRAARLAEIAAEASLEVARADALPDVSAFGRYTAESSRTDLPEPLGPLQDRSRRLAVGVTIELPAFDRNQGAKAEAAIAIAQSRRRRAFAEAVVRSEVASAVARFRAADAAIAIFERGVLPRAERSLGVLREAHRIGAFTVLELLAEQRRYEEAQSEYTALLAERARALAALAAATAAPVPRP